MKCRRIQILKWDVRFREHDESIKSPGRIQMRSGLNVRDPSTSLHFAQDDTTELSLNFNSKRLPGGALDDVGSVAVTGILEAHF